MTITFTTSLSGTATAGSDYTAPNGSVTFAPGSSTGTLSVHTIDDHVYEGAESVGVTLTRASDGGAVSGIGNGTINDIPPVYSISAPNSAKEGDALAFTVSASVASTQDVVVTTDHGAVTIKRGTTSGVLSVSTANDGVYGSHSADVTVALKSVTGGGSISPNASLASATTHLVDAQVALAVAPTIVNAGGLTNQASQTVSGTGEAGHTVSVLEGSTVLGTATVPSNGSWSTSVTLSGQGTHTLVAQETDAAGNFGESTPVSFILDTVSPGAPGLSLTTDSGIAGDGITNKADLTVASLESGASLSYSVDGGPASASYNPGQLTDGAHTVAVRQIDAAGNLSAASSVAFTLDTKTPGVVSIAPSSADAVKDGTLVETVTFSEAVKGVDASDFTITSDGSAGAHIASVVPVGSSGTTYSVTLDQLAGNGSIQLDLNSKDTGITDDAGNALAPGHTSGGTTTLSDPTPCYVTGTLILTARGEVPVEGLRVGDLAVTASGKHRPIRWIGHRLTDIARHPRPETVSPVRIRVGAMALGVPTRDLLVSPGHAVAIEGVLVKAGRLVNGATIVREDVTRVTYWHVELDSHDLLLADGMPAESYVDCGNRHAFDDGGPVVALHPAFDALRSHAAQSCLPLVDGGPALAAIREGLIARAGTAFSADPALQLMADGVALAPVSVEGSHYSFSVPEGTRSVRLLSRYATPSEVHAASRDRRRLGIALRGLEIDGAAIPCETLGEGWYEGAGRDHRWSDGDAALPLGREFAFTVCVLERYPVEIAAPNFVAA